MERYAYRSLQENLDIIIGNALKSGVFTTCSVGFSIEKNKKFFRKIYSYGFTEGEGFKKKVSEATFFDLASLTKPLVTSLSLLTLVEEKKIELSDTLDMFFKNFNKNQSDKGKINIAQLLSHSSGLPAHRPYFEKLITYPQNIRKNKVIEWVTGEKLCFEPGEDVLYSDLGYMLLGVIIEKISQESIDSFWRKKVAIPLKLEKDMFFPKGRIVDIGTYAATGSCGWSHSELCGKVHDDNCRAMGGVSGHAGLFGNAEGLLSFCERLIERFKGYRQFPEDIPKEFLKKQKGSSWTLGFDTPTPGCSSSGRYFSEQSIGHLGFTGTSFWIDLSQKINIVFLTNKVLCRESMEPFKKIRPIVHDTIMEELTGY